MSYLLLDYLLKPVRKKKIRFEPDALFIELFFMCAM
jgi:hypothetical protein